MRSGEKNGRSKLTLETVKEIRLQVLLDRKAGTKYATPKLLSEDYGVGSGTIRDILKGRSWKEPGAYPEVKW